MQPTGYCDATLGSGAIPGAGFTVSAVGAAVTGARLLAATCLAADAGMTSSLAPPNGL